MRKQIVKDNYGCVGERNQMPASDSDDAAASAVQQLEKLLALSIPSDKSVFDKVDLSRWDWAAVRVYLPQPEIESAITPPFMEAFLVLQKQIYQIAAFATSGIADLGQLGDGVRGELQLNVVVTKGSSNIVAELKEPLERLADKMVGKLNGKQTAIVLVCLGTLLTAGWSFNSWLDQTKEIKLEEIKSKDHRAALDMLEFSSKQQSESYKRFTEVLASQGEIGKRALDVVTETHSAFLKAASTSSKTRINSVELTREEAELLRSPSRKKAVQKIVKQEVKVVNIDTTDPLDLQIVLLDPSSDARHRIKLKDDLFSAEPRRRLFEALEQRTLLWVELAIKEVDGEIRSVQLLRTIEPPSDFAASIADQP